jgi:hypothetical protein
MTKTKQSRRTACRTRTDRAEASTIQFDNNGAREDSGNSEAERHNRSEGR